MLFKLFVKALIFSLTLNAYVFAQSEEEIRDLEGLLKVDLSTVQKIADDLMQVYNPRDYLYVTVGSSPVVLQAHFAINHPQVDIVNIPLSGLGSGNSANPDPNLENTIIEQRLQDFVGNKLDSSKNGIVLIDYVNTGRTLLRTYYITKNYFPHHQVMTYAFFKLEAQKIEWEQKGRRGIVIGSNSFGINVHKTKYNAWSEYLSVDYRKNQIVKNGWYRTLIQTMRELGTDSQTLVSPQKSPLTCAVLF